MGSDGGSCGGVSEEAVSKKIPTKILPIVRAVQKGRETSEEMWKRCSMKKKDVKDFASTKHKDLLEKESGRAYYGGEEQRKKDERAHTKNRSRKCSQTSFDSMGRELDPRW